MNTNNFKKLAIATGILISMGTISSAHAKSDQIELSNLYDVPSVVSHLPSVTDLSEDNYFNNHKSATKVSTSISNINDYKDYWVASTYSVGGTGGDPFNPIQTIKQWDPWVKPISIRIKADERIDKIEIVYANSEYQTAKPPLTYGGNGGHEDFFTLRDDEFIESVVICSTDTNYTKGRVSLVQITTTHKEKTYGKYCLSGGRYTAPTGWHIIGFKGRAGDEIDQLTPIFAPKLKIEATVNVGALQQLEDPQLKDYLSLPFMNDTSTTKDKSQSYIRTTGYTESTSWSNTSTFSLGYSFTQAHEVGLAVDGLSASSSYSHTVSSEFVNQLQYGQSNSVTNTTTDTATITIPVAPRTFEVVKVRTLEATATAPLDIYYRNIYTNTVHHSAGEIQKFDYNQVSTASFEVGVFVDGLIEVHPWYMNNPIYACFDGKTADDGQIYCPLN